VVGIILSCQFRLKPGVVLGVIWKVIQRNARFVLSDSLEVHLHHVMMPDGKGKMAEKTKGRSLDVISAMKRNTVVVEGAWALFIDMARVNSDPMYTIFRHGKCLKRIC